MFWPGREVAGQSRAVLLAQPFRHDQARQVAAERLRAGHLEHGLGRRVELNDAALAIHADDGVGAGFDNRSVVGVTLAQPRFGSAPLDRVANDPRQDPAFDFGLDQVVLSAGLDRGGGQAGVGETRQDDDGHATRRLDDPVQRCQAVAVGQTEVQQDDVDPAGPEEIHCGAEPIGVTDGECSGAKRELSANVVRVSVAVFDQKDADQIAHAALATYL